MRKLHVFDNISLDGLFTDANARGEYVPLSNQDQNLWDWPQIREAETLLLRAGAFRNPGRYQIEAALQSAHVHRCRTGESNWAEVVRLYDARTGGIDEARRAYDRAIGLERDPAVRAFLLRRRPAAE